VNYNGGILSPCSTDDYKRGTAGEHPGHPPAFIPHVSKIRKWFEKGDEMGWWTTDESYEAAPAESKNAIHLMGVLWCCDENTAGELTEMLLRQTLNSKLRASLMRSKLLPRIKSGSSPT